MSPCLVGKMSSFWNWFRYIAGGFLVHSPIATKPVTANGVIYQGKEPRGGPQRKVTTPGASLWPGTHLSRLVKGNQSHFSRSLHLFSTFLALGAPFRGSNSNLCAPISAVWYSWWWWYFIELRKWKWGPSLRFGMEAILRLMRPERNPFRSVNIDMIIGRIVI